MQIFYNKENCKQKFYYAGVNFFRREIFAVKLEFKSYLMRRTLK